MNQRMIQEAMMKGGGGKRGKKGMRRRGMRKQEAIEGTEEGGIEREEEKKE